MGESPIRDVDVKTHRQAMGMEPVLGRLWDGLKAVPYENVKAVPHENVKDRAHET